MHNIQVDRILTEAMGKEEHNLVQVEDEWICSCGYEGDNFEQDDMFEMVNHQPFSPTTNWQDYGEVIEWMKEQNLWQAFVQSLFDKAEHDDQVGDTANIFTNPETGSHALAEFIESEGV